MATQIRSGDYTLTIDPYCMWISKKVKSEKTGKVYDRRATGYYTDLGDLLEDFIKKAKSEDAKSLTGAIKKLKQAEKDAIAIAEQYKKHKGE